MFVILEETVCCVQMHPPALRFISDFMMKQMQLILLWNNLCV
ncbi:220L [Invertebrate iridescent virus Kaz2018]|uniref:220L n=1 Tax=Invertebrate iridescent virus 6 TaxID=176652 RepID=Q91FV1_IIV6|nr:220L [Invertebrate iridescent virus 6]AAK82082.1 220L [Invertebrate iridescent virus 6]QMS79451.1 hypothetical protein IIV6-T1_219 [Invertebrate iridescent virus 6]QNH08630.1 220L [Invertebrate iridescent virus Kaz2018]